MNVSVAVNPHLLFTQNRNVFRVTLEDTVEAYDAADDAYFDEVAKALNEATPTEVGSITWNSPSNGPTGAMAGSVYVEIDAREGREATPEIVKQWAPQALRKLIEGRGYRQHVVESAS